MAAPKLHAISRQFVRVPIEAFGSEASLLRTLPVRFAFMTDAVEQPDDTDWVLGSWEPTGSPAQARCLVGPGGTVELPPGTWYVWVWVDGALEAPREPSGKVVIV